MERMMGWNSWCKPDTGYKQAIEGMGLDDASSTYPATA